MSDPFHSGDDEIRRLREALSELTGRIDRAIARRPGAGAMPGDGVPVLVLPSQYHLAFQREATGEPLTVLFWQATGPWFFVHELADLLDPPAADLADLPGCLAARLPEDQRNTARRIDTGETFPIVTDAGLALLFGRWSRSLSDWDRYDIGRWIADRVIPSAMALRLKETELDPEFRPKDFAVAPTEVVADEAGLFKVYAGDLDGRPATLVNAREIYKSFGVRQSYAGWFDARGQRNGYRNGVHYSRVFVGVSRYDHYLTLEAADRLLCQETHPKAIAARAYLQKVARARAGVIEGVARRVGERELLPVKFQDETLFITGVDSEPFTPIRPIVEALGLGWRDQLRKLKGGGDNTAPLEGDGDIPTPSEDGKQPAYRFGIVVVPTRTAGGVQQTLCIPVRKLPGYLYSVPASKVRVDLREKLIRYQNECDEVLWQHWNEKIQQRPSAAEPIGYPTDTPSHAPLIIPFAGGQGARRRPASPTCPRGA
jgi:phage anti-repressor protein